MLKNMSYHNVGQVSLFAPIACLLLLLFSYPKIANTSGC